MNQCALDKSIEYIDSWLGLRYDHEDIPGFAVAISHKGKVIFNKAYGYADLEKKIKLTPDHIFRIASHSKTFTATAIMQLAEQGKLRIDDYASDYIDWLNQHSDKRWQKVTIRQLLSHGTGMIRDGQNANYWYLESPFFDKDTLKNEVLSSKLILDNNTKLKYSNLGYALLGLIIERASKEAYNQFVTNNIIKKLSLDNTGPEYNDSLKDKIATGYSMQIKNKTRLPISNPQTNALSPATGFYSTASDLCEYFSAHFVGSGKLLDDESKKEMQRVQFHCYEPNRQSSEDYGLGIKLERTGNRKLFGHGGGFPGFTTKTLADPKDQIVVSIMTNCIDAPADSINKGIYSILDFFDKNMTDKTTKNLPTSSEGRFINLWSISDIVVTDHKIIANYPNSWNPFEDYDELKEIDENTLKITDTSSFGHQDELIKINKDESGNVSHINYGGFDMYTEENWHARIKDKKIF